VIEINDELETTPELINRDPYGEGWIFKIEVSDLGEVDQLLDAEAYSEMTAEEH
jgi:glycine cleavage system H protein